MTNKSELVVKVWNGDIVCPHCGNDGTIPMDEQDLHAWGAEYVEEPKCIGFYLLEQITCYRRVTGFKDGKLQVNGFYQSGEGYDDGVPDTMRLECRKCCNEFPLPANLDVEWE